MWLIATYHSIGYFWLKNDNNIHIVLKISKRFPHYSSCQDICTNRRLSQCTEVHVVSFVNGEEGGLIVVSKHQTRTSMAVDKLKE